MRIKNLAHYIYSYILPIRINHPIKKDHNICFWNCANRKGKLTIVRLLKELRITLRLKENDKLIKVYKKGVY